MGFSPRYNIVKEESKADYDFILMTHLMDCGKQLQRLPHEMIDANLNRPIGTTHSEIVVSYADMIDHLEALLTPYRDAAYEFPRPDDSQTRELFQWAKDKFGALIKGADVRGLLLQKIRARATIDEDMEAWERDESNKSVEIPSA